MTPLETAGADLFLWGVGPISVFAAQGIGVLEFVAAGLFRSSGTLMSTVALLARFRFVILVADVFVWGIYQLIRVRQSD